ncbi:MAG: AAA family ATPase [Saprospiraceae bacterium]|nr:AAA family ATPase [Saprospiraceae bacterium]
MGYHILGAPGAGVSTLARALAQRLGYRHLDTDDFHWFTEDELPYRRRRNPDHRRQLLQAALAQDPNWILSGALCGWGEVFIPQFDAVIYLWLPAETRLERIRHREMHRYGTERIQKGGDLHTVFEKFCAWAAAYDDAEATHLRSKIREMEWLGQLACPVLLIEEELPVTSLVEKCADFLSKNSGY